MALVFDYKLNNELDLSVRRGDFVVDESTLQHQKMLLLAEKGEYKQNPLTGVGMVNYINNDANIVEYRHAVQDEFEADGMTVLEMNVHDYENVDIEADYKESDEPIQSNRS